MKNLTLIVHANILQDVADILRGQEAIQGFTIAHVEGHGENVEHNPFLSTRDKVVGQGIYWVTSVEEKGRL